MSAQLPTIDSFELARSSRRIEGELGVAQLPRLAEFVTSQDGVLRYHIEGVIDDEGHPGADLHLKGQLQLICQRCNAPVDFALDRTTRFHFVETEEELNALPIEDDETDAVVGSRTMSIHDWIEDEAILSLPLVPRHDECSPPSRSESDPGALTSANPFAVLLALRGDGNGNTGRG